MSMKTAVFAAGIFCLVTTAASASTIDEAGVGYFIKSYKGSEEQKYFPRGLEINVGKSWANNIPIETRGRYRYLTTDLFLSGGMNESKIHQGVFDAELRAIVDGVNSFFVIGSIENEWESISSSAETYSDFTYSVGLMMRSYQSDSHFTEASVKYRKSDIGLYDSDIVFKALWHVPIFGRYAIQPSLEASTNLDAVDASILLNIKL